MYAYLSTVNPDCFYQEKFEGDPARYCRVEAPAFAKDEFLSHLEDATVFCVPPQEDALQYCQADRDQNLASDRSWLTVHNQANQYRDVFLNFASSHCFADTLPKFLDGENPAKKKNFLLLFLLLKKKL